MAVEFQTFARGGILFQRISLPCKKFQALAKNFTYFAGPAKSRE